MDLGRNIWDIFKDAGVSYESVAGKGEFTSLLHMLKAVEGENNSAARGVFRPSAAVIREVITIFNVDEKLQAELEPYIREAQALSDEVFGRGKKEIGN